MGTFILLQVALTPVGFNETDTRSFDLNQFHCDTVEGLLIICLLILHFLMYSVSELIYLNYSYHETLSDSVCFFFCSRFSVQHAAV